MTSVLSRIEELGVPCFLVGPGARSFVQNGSMGTVGIHEVFIVGSIDKILEDSSFRQIHERKSGHPYLLEWSDDQNPQWFTVRELRQNGETIEESVEMVLSNQLFRLDGIAVTSGGTIIDPLGARKDLESKTIRVNPETELKFDGNPLHFLQACSLVSELGFRLSDSMHESIKSQATKVLYARRTGWFRELTKVLCGPYVYDGLQVLYETRLLGLLLPEIEPMVGFAETSKYHHKDLWDHTRKVVQQAATWPLVRWAALLHDAGKVWTRTYSPPRGVHFFQHEEMGAILVEGIGARFHMPEWFRKKLEFIVRYHQRPSAYASKWTDSAVRRLIRECGPNLEPLLCLSEADITSAIPQKRRESERLSLELRNRVQLIIAKDNQQSPLPKGIGKQLIESLKLSPGPHIGQLKKHLEGLVETGVLEPHQGSEYYVLYLQGLPNLPV